MTERVKESILRYSRDSNVFIEVTSIKLLHIKKMMLRDKKGQTAVEYLLTYGWAMIVLAVALVVLWHMDAFKPPKIPPACSGFEQVEPMDWRANSSAVILILRNNAGTKITLKKVELDIFGHTCFQAMSHDIRSGGTYQVNVSGCILPDVDEYYKMETIIRYTNIASGMQHNSVGSCHGYVER